MKWIERAVLAACLTAVTSAGLTGQSGSSATAPGMGIRPGDVLVVSVYKQPELSIEQAVPPDGHIVFYRLGPIDVRGLEPEALRQRLEREYARYIVEPSIRLETLWKVTISGAVRSPNVFKLPPSTSISDALASAGGPDEDGRTDVVELRRDGKTIEILLLRDAMTLAESPIRSGDQLYVPLQSWVARNIGTITTAATGVIAVVVALVARK